jgi:hypothetical protein
MRKIELQMITAIRYNRNWANANTMVNYNPDTGLSTVYLHGHKIATATDAAPYEPAIADVDTLQAWPTRTTMSRLRALGVDVCTRKGVVLLDGKEVA